MINNRHLTVADHDIRILPYRRTIRSTQQPYQPRLKLTQNSTPYSAARISLPFSKLEKSMMSSGSIMMSNASSI